MKRIVIVSDAWFPQVNGVVRTLNETVIRLRARGYQVVLITPDLFYTLPCPGYSEIRLAVAPRMTVRRMLNQTRPDIVHISTEGPLGWSARAWCIANDMPFTTAFHTRFPDYAAARTGLSAERFWPLMRRFHAPSNAVLVATHGLIDELNERGIMQTRIWSRGVDLDLFHACQPPHAAMRDLPRPVMLSVGRVAVEKNIEAFLSVDVPGSKVVVGDGPMLAQLASKYPDAIFLGKLGGAELASAYSAADLFVFPSRTDTFGLVMVEALASGVPVAGYPVAGPLDVVGATGNGPGAIYSGQVGVLDEDLSVAIRAAQDCGAEDCVAAARFYDWENTVDQFVAALTDALRPMLHQAA
ncbi:MAG: glycosyltransferase family 1 protein [Sphingorhabdus sp.]